MTLEQLREQIPDYAKDIRLNLGSLANETTLTDQQKWGTFLASAVAIGQPQVVQAFEAEAQSRLSPQAMDAARSAAAIMAMNNVYYRALHLMHNPEYQTLRAGLRMNVLANPGVEKIDFELWSLAVSAINGCGMCLDSHEAELKKHGVPALTIQAALRIASVVAAASAVLRAIP
ncbi:alkyl hydroperoxide reductase AhpD [Candidatus Phycosocius bacilliformis]|jgi:alkyl hydroperoxide reductase subunit D|uniref:Alkyl hydroperoxide reductase AhpD n=1 Tax=Candidatus Phycosocius bacilliformis TaxID=1445552 RepID=A0A2P2E5P8_9PROT|nr:carboxymuconolactone decarboxylase family protein [Candidatus Phycosocius bacilliformis]GBF56384.1 alkyl hydroperoxide reductase AhpD [Candidatus Phycosocius bacilliformis]